MGIETIIILMCIAGLFGFVAGFFLSDFLHKHDFVESIGTLYISFEEDDVPIYFVSNLDLERLAKCKSGTVEVHRG